MTTLTKSQLMERMGSDACTPDDFLIIAAMNNVAEYCKNDDIFKSGAEACVQKHLLVVSGDGAEANPQKFVDAAYEVCVLNQKIMTTNQFVGILCEIDRVVAKNSAGAGAADNDDKSLSIGFLREHDTDIPVTARMLINAAICGYKPCIDYILKERRQSCLASVSEEDRAGEFAQKLMYIQDIEIRKLIKAELRLYIVCIHKLYLFVFHKSSYCV
jgi:hypothetical protein